MLAWISGSSNSSAHDGYTRQCSLSGYLYKMKRQRKLLVPQWNKRWFSIEGKFFKWYETSSTEDASGEIDLKKVTYITKFEMQGAFSFIIGYPDRNLMLRADTSECMDKWIRALQLQADIARGGNGMNIITGSSPSSPSSRHRQSAKKKSSSLEAELDRSMKQLQDLEKQIKSKGDDSSSRSNESYDRSFSSGSSYAYGVNKPAPAANTSYNSKENYLNSSNNVMSGHSNGSGKYSSSSSSSSSSSAAQPPVLATSSRNSGRIKKGLYDDNSNGFEQTNPSHSSKSSRRPSNDPKQQQQQQQQHATGHDFSYADAYPNLESDFPKTNDILVDVVDRSIYSTLTKASSRTNSRQPSSGNISYQENAMKRKDSDESLEEIIDRPVRRANSKTSKPRNDNNDDSSYRTVASTASISTSGNSGRIPPSHPSSRPSSTASSRPSSSSSNPNNMHFSKGQSVSSGFTTEEDGHSGRSAGSQYSPYPLPYRINSASSTSSNPKNMATFSYDNKLSSDDDHDIQEVQMNQRQLSRRGSSSNPSRNGNPLSSRHSYENSAW